ncbi:hypothetical protein JTE90_001402 [Oedothorax gibbosus]|uniref:Uncharacterized protein n=1 Tax=Oedothorax gibbosus TaxID=931172 RepID=A0AAV6VH10_9ARAC|nr:hypothetical protein JTE90_001402 [Oedothorax gibbosus]
MLIWLLFGSVAALFDAISTDSIADQYLDSILHDTLDQLLHESGLDPATLPDFGIRFNLPVIPLSGRVEGEWDVISTDSIADQYLDSILHHTLDQLIHESRLDPATLPDFGIPFTLPVIPLSGRVDFVDGVFNGLSRIRRFSRCQDPSVSVQEIRLECGLNFFGMDVVYEGRARVEQLPAIPFQVTAYINETHVKSVISGSPASLNGRLNLLQIEKFGDVNARLSNLGFIQPLYNAVEEKFREKIKDMLTDIILNQFPVPFGKAILKTRLPGLTG